MKKKIISTLKIVLPLAFGIFIIWYVYDKLLPAEKEKLFDAIYRANYFWIIVSLGFGVLSHVSRAYRWKYLLNPLGLQPKFLNSFYAVMIGYMMNLVLPRVGEVARCGAMSKYEKMPFDKLFGTVVAERIFDMAILTIIIVSLIFMQLDVLKEVLNSMLAGKSGDESPGSFILIAGIVFTIAMAATIIFIKKSKHPLAGKIKTLILGFIEGLKSIGKMKDGWKFIMHTLFIWLMYIVMFYICFFALPETSETPLAGIMAAFAMGGISIVIVQGGIGVYPVAIQVTLMLYGVSEGIGQALGWIIWVAQTFMLISIGAFSMIMMPYYNKKLARG
ncbi:flippase-like domain-containing protein [Bacteroidales bacterium AH-315-I05]|nr:flippase-like domain-containing protein [Bacteroidales bacterium AH-315-I05]